MAELRGVYAVLATPFDENEALSEEWLRGEVEYLITKGIHGVIATGSTGEFASLTDEERYAVWDITIDQARGRVPVWVGASSNATRDTIRHTRHAEEIKADGVMIVHPYYALPDQNELYMHYKNVAESTRLPIMIYNNVSCTGVDMLPQTVARLAEIDNIRAIKESSTDVKRVHQIIRMAGENITVFCGWCDIALESFVLGAQGWVSAAALISPEDCVELYDLAVVQKDFEQARTLYLERVVPVAEIVEETGKFVQLVKAGLEMRGVPVGIPRRPVLPASDELIDELRRLLTKLGLVN